MSNKYCPTEAALLSFADAALSPEELSRVQQHLVGCGACAQQVETLRDLIAGIAAPVGSDLPLTVAAHVDAVMARLDGPSPSLRRPKRALWAGAMTAAAAAAALLVLQLKPEPEVAEGHWAARGSSAAASLTRDVGVQLYAREPALRPLGPGSRVPADAAFTAGLRNLSDEQAYLLLFAVDARQVVHWITPRFTDPKSDPEAAPIAPSSSERLLSSAVVFDDLEPGTLRVVALITAQPTHVSQLEALSATELSGERWMERFPLGENRQVTIAVTP